MVQRKKRGKKSRKSQKGLTQIHSLAVGIDIGSEEHWVCCPPGDDGDRTVLKFGTTTSQLESIANLLQSLGDVSVAMESTYLYWIPLFEILEARGIDVILVNARDLKGVPSRTKTDALDCQWIQKLHSFGLVKKSFRPPQEVRAMRSVQRLIAKLNEERTRRIQAMQSPLDQMNVQLHRAVTDITGVTGTRIIEAILDGERDPLALAQRRDHRCKKSIKQIADHLNGTWIPEHLFALDLAYDQLRETEEKIRRCEAKLLQMLQELEQEGFEDAQVAPNPDKRKEDSIQRRGQEVLRQSVYRFLGCDLTLIPGISPETALIVATEIGLEVSAFPSEKHLVSWLGLCPKMAISGGKPVARRRHRVGANRIVQVLYVAAMSLKRTDTAIGAYYRKVSRTKNGKVAALATARKLTQYIYRMLRFGEEYIDQGAEAYEEQFRARRVASLEKTAKSLGYQLVAAG